MTEIVVALLVFLSISVFLAHAFDAYRTVRAAEPKPRPFLLNLSRSPQTYL
jgi:hypothetical protein